jgi:hypothetical protein
MEWFQNKKILTARDTKILRKECKVLNLKTLFFATFAGAYPQLCALCG